MKSVYKFISVFVLIFIVSGLFAANDSLVRLKIQRSTYTDELLMRFKYVATDNFDGSYDAFKMYSLNNADPQIWSVTPNNEELSINSFPFNSGLKSFPIGFKTNVADSFTITAYGFSKIDTNIRLYLLDSLGNKLIDIRKDSVYKFYSAKYNNKTRFKFIFAGVTTYSDGVLDFGLPDSLVTLKVLDSNLVLNNTVVSAYDVLIEPDAGLTLNTNCTLNVKNDFIIKSGASGDGSFIQNGTLICKGEVIVQKYFADATASGWYIASPISNADVNILNGSNGVWYFDALSAQWVKQTSGPLIPLNGYVTKFAGMNKTVNFSGVLNNNVIGYDLVRTADYGGNFGWNLIGNPFPSSIDWDLILADDKVNLNDAIYYRKLNGQVASYVDNAGNNGGTSIIPPMQAFWVQVTLGETYGSIVLNNNYRIHSKQHQYKSINNSPDLLSFIISDNIFEDETIIRLNSNAQNEFDKKYDAHKFFSENPSHPQIYTITPLNNELSINTLPLVNTASVVNLAFFSPSSISLNISFQNTQSFIADYQLYFEDTYNNTLIDIRQDNNYSFITTQGTFKDRFKIHIIPVLNNISVINMENSLSVNYNNATLYIQNISDKEILYLSIYNTLGQCIEKSSMLHKSNNYSKNILLSKGLYLIDLYATDGTLIKQKKIIVP